MTEYQDKRNFFSRLRYRYEVTLGLYMLTTTEKIVLSKHSLPRMAQLTIDFIFVSFFTMLVLSSWFYLPSHIAAISRHMQYYLFSDGDDGQMDLR
jgi:hypothetical protein